MVGGGVAGLATALTVRRQGLEVLVVEAQPVAGGRVRTDQQDGFLLDRGFAVVNTSYPALKRFAPPAGLALRPLPAAASVWWDGRMHAVGHPLLSPQTALASMRAPFVSASDVRRLSAAGAHLLRSNRAAIGSDVKDLGSEEWLRQRLGISPALIDAFLRPFFGGVLLDPELGTSARCLRYDLRQFALGRAALPSRGMRAVAEVMVARLGQGRLRLGAAATALLRDGSGVAGVRLAGGEEVRARVTVVAVEAPEAARLTGLDLPVEGVGEVCVHAAVDRALLPGGRLLLDPTAGAAFSNAVEPSAVAPGYAPAGRHSLMLVAPGALGAGAVARDDARRRWDDATWGEAARAALATWFPALTARAVEVLRVDRIPFGLLRQPPGIHARLRALGDPGVAGLLLAGEHTLAASLNAAMLSGGRAGRRAARLVAQPRVEDRRRR